MLLGYLDRQRETMIVKADGLTDEQARSKPTPDGNSLLNLIYHLGGVEARWTNQMILGLDHERNREAEFGDLPGVTLVSAVDRYRAAYAHTNDVVTQIADVDTPCKQDPNVSIRWVLLHLLEETARHAGHADLARELIDGTTGI